MREACAGENGGKRLGVWNWGSSDSRQKSGAGAELEADGGTSKTGRRDQDGNGRVVQRPSLHRSLQNVGEAVHPVAARST